jgi:hypothetical protein
MMSLDYTATGPSHLSNSAGGRKTTRVPTAAKNKRGDPAQKSGISSGTPSTSETESDDDRDAQIQIDAKVAAAWSDRERRRLKKERRQELKNDYLLAKVKALEAQVAASSKRTSANTIGSTESSQSRRTHLHEHPSKQLPKNSHLRQAMFETGGCDGFGRFQYDSLLHLSESSSVSSCPSLVIPAVRRKAVSKIRQSAS